jgi:hypothetical protein
MIYTYNSNNNINKMIQSKTFQEKVTFIQNFLQNEQNFENPETVQNFISGFNDQLTTGDITFEQKIEENILRALCYQVFWKLVAKNKSNDTAIPSTFIPTLINLDNKVILGTKDNSFGTKTYENLYKEYLLSQDKIDLTSTSVLAITGFAKSYHWNGLSSQELFDAFLFTMNPRYLGLHLYKTNQNNQGLYSISNNNDYWVYIKSILILGAIILIAAVAATAITLVVTYFISPMPMILADIGIKIVPFLYSWYHLVDSILSLYIGRNDLKQVEFKQIVSHSSDIIQSKEISLPHIISSLIKKIDDVIKIQLNKTTLIKDSNNHVSDNKNNAQIKINSLRQENNLYNNNYKDWLKNNQQLLKTIQKKTNITN